MMSEPLDLQTRELIEWRSGVTNKLDTIISNTADHESRLRSLEKEQWMHRGGLAVVAVMFVGFLRKMGFYG